MGNFNFGSKLSRWIGSGLPLLPYFILKTALHYAHVVSIKAHKNVGGSVARRKTGLRVAGGDTENINIERWSGDVIHAEVYAVVWNGVCVV